MQPPTSTIGSLNFLFFFFVYRFVYQSRLSPRFARTLFCLALETKTRVNPYFFQSTACIDILWVAAIQNCLNSVCLSFSIQPSCNLIRDQWFHLIWFHKVGTIKTLRLFFRTTVWSTLCPDLRLQNMLFFRCCEVGYFPKPRIRTACAELWHETVNPHKLYRMIGGNKRLILCQMVWTK